MVTLNLEQRALELLAAEYERDGKAGSAHHIRTQPLLPNKARAVRAIAAALHQQPAPVMNDARMARALEWMRALAKPCSAEEREMLGSIEEAVAAYNPNCGARTVRVVDDAVREDAERYRWLRKHVTDTHANYRDANGHLQGFDFDCEGDVELDAAIDAARAQGVRP